jgi:hypothetical protein
MHLLLLLVVVQLLLLKLLAFLELFTVIAMTI